MRQVVDPLEFSRRCRNPELLAVTMDKIEEWRAQCLPLFPAEDVGSREGIALQVHLRVLLTQFSLAQPEDQAGMAANASLTALAHCIGLILAEGEANGFPRNNGLQMVIARINGVVDDEMERERASR